MPSYRPCMANNSAGTKLGAASGGQKPNLKTGVIHGGRSAPTITLSTGRVLPVRFIGEQHVLEDLGRVPTVADWLGRIQPESWMLGRGKSQACNHS